MATTAQDSLVPLSHQGNRIRSDPTTIFWDTGDTAKLGSAVIMSRGSSDTVTDYTKTITTYTSRQNSAPVNRLRFTPPTSQNGSNTRIWYPINNSQCVDSEIRSLWYGHSGIGGGHGQFGHVHRLSATGNAGKPWGYIAWQDIIFSSDQIMNLNTWTTDGAASPPINVVQGVTGGNVWMDSVEDKLPVIACSKFGSTVMVRLNPNHRILVGDLVTLEGGTDLDEGGSSGIAVTAVGTTWIQFTSTVGYTFANVPYGGVGQLRVLSRIMPYWVASRLVGTTLRAKAWPLRSAEPDWNDETFAGATVGMTDGPGATTQGLCGIYAGHLTTPVTDYIEYGSVTWRSLD